MEVMSMPYQSRGPVSYPDAPYALSNPDAPLGGSHDASSFSIRRWLASANDTHQAPASAQFPLNSTLDTIPPSHSSNRAGVVTPQSISSASDQVNAPEEMSPSVETRRTRSQEKRRASSDSDKIVSYLQIPGQVNDSKGSLADFAAQVDNLSVLVRIVSTLYRVEESTASPDHTTPLITDALPTMGFRKWVTTILSTTQVTQNVVLLALLLIYRLKQFNPSIKGKVGSEYRLLTVALMLSNKFLDDNTYTNKTWADVSGISVSEISMMEIEFLGSMKYTLFTSSREWKVWHKKLARFWEHFDKASKAIQKQISPPMNHLNSPVSLLPSPLSHTVSTTYANINDNTSSRMLTPLSQPMYLAQPSILPCPDKLIDAALRPSRKRSLDETSQEPLAKRVARNTLTPSHSMQSANVIAPAPRLPNLATSKSTNGVYNTYAMASNGHTSQLPQPHIPAMSLIYGNNQTRPLPHPALTPTQYSFTTPSTAQSILTPLSSLPSAQSILTPLSSLPSVHNRTILHPHPHPPSQSTSRNVSPTSASFPEHNLSPAIYPMSHHNSPYRPFRGPHTLLAHPPSALLHNSVPLRNFSAQDMQYLPLGQPASQSRNGVVPYMVPGAYQLAPQLSPWPYLPQTAVVTVPAAKVAANSTTAAAAATISNETV